MKIALLALALAVPASAQVTDDSDLSGPPPKAFRFLSREARLEGLKVSPRADGRVSARVLLADRSGALKPARLAKARLVGPGAPAAWTPIADDGSVSWNLPGAGRYSVRVSLDNERWKFQSAKAKAGYEWESAPADLPAGGADLGGLKPAAGSEHVKLGVLHLTYVDAVDFLAREGDLAWWDQTLTVNWPGSADYFSPWSFSLELTEADHWDVVLHELGHAVMHKAMKAQSAGGSHKIDECYSPALAWSEGWATFFAAAVRLSRADADAKFEFLVPRRAPIRLENVPEDVCQGQANEWRVAAAMWDLYDTHDDHQDAVGLDFARVWKPLRGARMGSLADAWGLIAPALDPVNRRAAQAALSGNGMAQPPAEVSVSVPSFTQSVDALR